MVAGMITVAVRLATSSGVLRPLRRLPAREIHRKIRKESRRPDRMAELGQAAP